MTNEKIGIVVAEYNSEITELMYAIAAEHVKFLGAEVVQTIKVPGTFDIPLAVKKLVEKDNIDGVITLGAVIQGDTTHDEIVAHNAARKIADISVASGKPVSLGISGPRMSRQDAVKRIESYAERSAETVIKMIRRLSDI